MKRVSRFGVAVLLLCACAAADESTPKDADPEVAAIQARIETDTANWQHYVSLSSELRHKDRLEEAAQAAEKAFQLAPSPGFEARLEMAKVYAAADRSASAINLVKDAEKKKRDEGAVVDEVKIAEVYAVLGDVSAVFRWLDRAAQAHSPNMAGLATNREFDALRDDPRFKAYAGAQ
jgi:tetratricopeptide (TPR) repeat protein